MARPDVPTQLCARLEKAPAPDPSRARGSPHPRVAPPARFPRGSSDPAPFVREMSAAPRDPRNHWSEAEHAAFLRGLEAHGRGNWAAIARDYVPTRTNQQVYSHASKWFEVQAKRELHDANAGSANPHRGARRPGSREEPGDDAFGPSSRTIPIPPPLGDLAPAAAAGAYGAPDANGFFVTARGTLRCFRCHTCRNPTLKRRCRALPEDQDRQNRKTEAAFAADGTTQTAAAAADNKRRRVVAFVRRRRPEEEDEQPATPSADARANANDDTSGSSLASLARWTRETSEERDAAAAAAAAAADEGDDLPRVALYSAAAAASFEEEDRHPKRGEDDPVSSSARHPLVVALAASGAEAFPPATRATLGGRRGGGELARVVSGVLGALVRGGGKSGGKRGAARGGARGETGTTERGRVFEGGSPGFEGGSPGFEGGFAPLSEGFGFGGGASSGVESGPIGTWGAFACDAPGCDRRYPDAKRLQKHRRTHGGFHYPCRHPNCGKRFLDSSKLRRHWRMHVSANEIAEVPRVCPYPECCAPFEDDDALAAHMTGGAHDEGKFFLCTNRSCVRRFTRLDRLREHLASRECR